MKTLLIGLLLAGTAFAESEEEYRAHHPVVRHLAGAHAGAEEKHEKSAPEFIIDHVSDGDEWEFEIPFPGIAHQPTVRLGEIFEGLRWEKVPGACSKKIEGPLSAMPSLGRFFEGCTDLRPTKATLMMWFAAALLILLVLVGVNRDKTKLVPSGVLPNVIEVLVLFVRDDIVYSSIGRKEGDRYVPYLCTVFFFILFMNWLGLVPNFGSATGQLSVTLVLAAFSFVIVQVAGIRAAGLGGYFAHLTAGTPVGMWILMIPIEFLGLFIKPFALMIRLFANMLGGHIALLFIIGLIFLLHPAMAVFSVPVGVGIYVLEIFVGILQAYVFTLLTALFIGQGVEMGAHGHHAEEAAGHGH
jgi:F-type H+-transporting ATPase subunit a